MLTNQMRDDPAFVPELGDADVVPQQCTLWRRINTGREQHSSSQMAYCRVLPAETALPRRQMAEFRRT